MQPSAQAIRVVAGSGRRPGRRRYAAPVNPDGVARRDWRVLVSTLARLGLAAVFLISGAIKAANSTQTWVAVQAYQLMPRPMVTVVAGVLPWFELALGVLLLLGLGVRVVAVVGGVLLLAFIAGVAQAWVRGLSIDCGCFGGGGAVAANETSYGTELLRDSGFLILVIWLVIRPRTLFALESVWDGGGRPRPSGEGT
jgi:uncharacterized membrane protein YphA (DoxX/SURF4 family)